jgi:hypothetical protein
MKCAVCEKESNNKRVCPFCFTPYPPEEVGARSGSHQRVSQQAARASQGSARASQQVQRQSGASSAGPSPLTLAVGRARDFVMRQSPVVRWSGAGILFVLLLWVIVGGEEGPTFTPGTVPSNVIATPMQREEAEALIRHTRETALVEEQSGDELFVSYPAATFPVREDGQVALAQQFARADEIVSGRKRRITFYNPNGRIFAQADPIKGVTVVR